LTTFGFVQSDFQGGQDTYSTKARSGSSGGLPSERGLLMETGQYRPITPTHEIRSWCMMRGSFWCLMVIVWFC